MSRRERLSQHDRTDLRRVQNKNTAAALTIRPMQRFFQRTAPVDSCVICIKSPNTAATDKVFRQRSSYCEIVTPIHLSPPQGVSKLPGGGRVMYLLCGFVACVCFAQASFISRTSDSFSSVRAQIGAVLANCTGGVGPKSDHRHLVSHPTSCQPDPVNQFCLTVSCVHRRSMALVTEWTPGTEQGVRCHLSCGWALKSLCSNGKRKKHKPFKRTRC